ncbi:MAG: beta-lactamase family protein [Ignavibacteriales bacterium]|nr:beta-lactamase family protein [Ignavibacteriales bacterium]
MKRLSTHQFLLVVLFFVIILPARIYSQPNDSQITKVENGLLPYTLIEGEPSFNLHDRMEYYKVPGVSIAVIKDYKIEWTKQYGVMDSGIQNPVTDKTLFNVGSLSKGVAALTVLNLVNEEKLI